MKIVVVGSEGSTGRRYSHILKRMHHVIISYDINDINQRIPLSPDHRYVICSPTQFHADQCIDILTYDHDATILCEKPLCMLQDLSRLEEAQAGTDGIIHMVNNWNFLLPDMQPWSHVITYDYYNAGRRNDLWDMCQPYYLSQSHDFQFNSHILQVAVDGVPITAAMFDHSYWLMLEDWLTFGGHGWGLIDWRDCCTRIHQEMQNRLAEAYK